MMIQELTWPSESRASSLTGRTSYKADEPLVGHAVERRRAPWIRLDLLCQVGCDIVQGYHLSRPKSAGDVTAWLRAQPVSQATRQLPTGFPR